MPVSDDDKSRPVLADHVTFAQEVVALARKHQVGKIDITFSLTGGQRFWKDSYNPISVRATWSEGRHGDKSEIALSAQSSVYVKEKEPE